MKKTKNKYKEIVKEFFAELEHFFLLGKDGGWPLSLKTKHFKLMGYVKNFTTESDYLVLDSTKKVDKELLKEIKRQSRSKK